MADDTAISLTLELGLDPPARVVDTGGELTFVARVNAKGKPVDGVRPRLSVVFVLDTSTSMKGEPIEQVLDSVTRLVDLLQPTDKVGVVAFADSATQVHALQTLDGATKGALKRRVQSMKAHGNTNIEAGLRLASTMWGERSAHERRLIVLLSDGAPNVEAATVDALTDVTAPLRQDASVVTLGYGPGHNADVLSAIARAGGGTYWFIPDPKEANLEFARALGAQGDIVIDGLELVLTPADGVEVDGVLGAAGKTKVSAQGLVVPLPDLHEDGSHIVVARVLVPPQQEPGRAAPLRVRARYRRAGHSEVQSIEMEAVLEVFTDAARLTPRVQWVAQAIVLSRAELARVDARGHADRGNFDAAAAVLRKMMKDIEQAPGYVVNDTSPLAEAYEQLVDEVMAYETKPSAENYKAFRSQQLGVDVQQGGVHVAQASGRSVAARAMVAQLAGASLVGDIVVQSKGGAAVRYPIGSNELTIGRVQGNDIVLAQGNLSKRHTRVVFRDGNAIVVDLKSTNGTFVNGKRIGSPHVMREGDKIFIGDFTLTIELKK